jgi:hypothetical protein
MRRQVGLDFGVTILYKLPAKLPRNIMETSLAHPAYCCGPVKYQPFEN